MTWRAALPTLVLALGWPTAAMACSTDFDAETYARKVEARPDVRKLEGRFFVDRVERSDGGKESYIHGFIYGRVVTADRDFATVQTFTEPEIACLIYPKPATNAQGTFYITRSPAHGRFEILLWEGRYLDEAPAFEIPPPGAEKDNRP